MFILLCPEAVYSVSVGSSALKSNLNQQKSDDVDNGSFLTAGIVYSKYSISCFVLNYKPPAVVFSDLSSDVF